MTVSAVAEMRIGRPRAEVAAYAMDPANDTVWIGGVVESKALFQGPIGPGARVERVAKFMGRRFRYVSEVAAHEPGSALAMSVATPFPMRLHYEFEDAGGGTLARVRAEGEPGGFFRLAGPLLARSVQRNITRDLVALKRALEG